MKLSENVTSIFAAGEDGAVVSVQTILDRVSVKGFGILLVIFAIPSAMPLPAPGYSTPFGFILVLLGVQLFKGREYPWLPQKVLDRKVGIGEKPRLIKTMIFFLRILEFFIRPRLGFMFNNTLAFRFLATIVILCAGSMIIPIPLTNTTPAFGIFLIGLGMLEEDGLMSIGGVLASLVGLALSATVLIALVFFGWEGIELVRDAIKSIL
ncbi:MAG: exopolysaccharide biosynthesis protein [Candidatus Hydrogenedentes bacterium]|mgnify:CR=1 FL=1|nr:exopolysaccharide biosynthesis protein [Candidatus Hydrogenedentota bacterium]